MTALEYGNAPSRHFLRVPRYVGAVSWSRSRRSGLVKTVPKADGVSEDIKMMLLFAILWYGGVRLSEALKIKITDVQQQLRASRGPRQGGWATTSSTLTPSSSGP